MWAFKNLLKTTILAFGSIWLWSFVAVAEVGEHHLTIDANSPSYNALIQKAESLAKKSIDEAFQKNSNLESFTVMILGERRGQIVPILRTRVTRSQWQANGDVSEWTRYFNRSESLLGYNQPAPAESGPGAASRPQTRPQPNRQPTPSQPSASPVPPPPPATAQTQPAPTPPQPASPQTRPDPAQSPNISRLEPRRTPGRRAIENDPGFRDD